MFVPAAQVTAAAKDDVLITCEPGNVTTKGDLVAAIAELVLTVIGMYVAPIGAVTVSDVTVAVLTVARVAPKYTMLFDGVGSKLVPVIVTTVPIGPDEGANDVMVGVCASNVLTLTRIAAKIV